MSTKNFLLYLKALIWSIFVSYTNATVSSIVACLREGRVLDEYPEFKDTHLGEGLRFILENIVRQDDRDRLADCLEHVKESEASIIYRNMVIEVGHYVTSNEVMDDVPVHCPGVVYCLKSNLISVVFYKADKTLSAKQVRPFQVMPVYTLTIPEPNSETS